MITKTVKNCQDCPFVHVEYDDYSTGDSSTIICVLSSSLSNDNYIINTYNNSYFNIDMNKPTWCPLLKDDYMIKT